MQPSDISTVPDMAATPDRLRLGPEPIDVERFNKAAALHRSGALAEAEEIYRALPDHPLVRQRLCQTLLSQGKIAEGMALYEERFAWPVGPVPMPQLPWPRWDGSPVESVLIYPEQGLGDQIQFARYIPLLPNVSIASASPLARLFEQLGRPVYRPGAAIPKHAAWVAFGSLPHLVGGLPTAPYLIAEPRAAGGVGICWKGAPDHPNDANRSMANGDLLLSLPGAISLHPEDTGAKDMLDTAEIIAGLDCIVSVDTSVVHLAGAMGKPTFVLVPALNPDWRWTRGDRTPWYPSVRVIHQPSPGDWGGCIDAVLRQTNLNRKT